MFKYKLKVSMHKFKRDVLLVNFKSYFTGTSKTHTHSMTISETNYFFLEFLWF